MNEDCSRIAHSMRRDWDDRAQKDAFYYIASWQQDWDEESFLRSGEEDYLQLVGGSLQRQNFSTAGKTMLELGCGAGRMTGSFAQRFGSVIAFDVSSAMLERGRTLHSQLPRVTWLLGSGTDLSIIPSDSIDFVFSYLVLQHFPAERLVYNYVDEIMRVLVKGGLCLFQYNGSKTHNMNWRGRTAWGIVDLLWSAGLNSLSKWTAIVLGLDPKMGGKSWHGVSVPKEQISEIVRRNGGMVLERNGEDTAMAWLCAKKLSAFEETPRK